MLKLLLHNSIQQSIYQFTTGVRSGIIILLIIVTVYITISIIPIQSEVHLIHSNNTQVWKNPDDDLEIQFGYRPEKPVIYTFTNLRNDQHLKDLLAQVTVTDGQRLFKFQNISTQSGDSSVDYIFPDDGTHQVLLRIDKNESIDVASFSVFVPHQSPPNILDNQGNLIISMGILVAVAVITMIMLMEKEAAPM